MGLQGFQAANPINPAVADMRRRHVSKLYTPTESVANTKHAKRHTIALQYFSSAELLEMAMERERESFTLWVFLSTRVFPLNISRFLGPSPGFWVHSPMDVRSCWEPSWNFPIHWCLSRGRQEKHLSIHDVAWMFMYRYTVHNHISYL